MESVPVRGRSETSFKGDNAGEFPQPALKHIANKGQALKFFYLARAPLKEVF